MKTLYESILDDEDVLISKATSDAKNPFIALANLNNIQWDNKDIVLDIIKRLEFPKHVLQNKEKIPFNKECLGVKTYDAPSGEKGYMVTYDKEKILEGTPGYRKNWYPPIILYIKILGKYSNNPNFLLNGKIITDLGPREDMKEVFGSSAPVKSILNKWSKKYNTKIQDR
jgi:hypothetical protein